jgi:aspartate-semialdehyde dehydrogenase
MSGVRVAVVGATGLVGETLAKIMTERRFPATSLRAFATKRSAGEIFRTCGMTVPVEAIDHQRPDFAPFDDIDIAFLAAGDSVSAAFGRALAERGKLVIDKSAVYRLDDDVPLVVPEVNAAAIQSHRLIANPNCSTIPLAIALAPIDREFGLTWVSVATYQSVSGAGREALEAFAIAGNVMPEIGEFDRAGDSGEEQKIAAELRKILHRPDLRVSATTVRVPVRIGHSEAVSFGLARPASSHALESVLRTALGVTYDDKGYATPLDVAGTDAVAVSRLRRDRAHDDAWLCWVVSDNLRKGAATNAVQIAEAALERARVEA